MSDLFTTDDEMDFTELLSELIKHAYHNGTDPEGAWKCSINAGEDFHWDVQITRVEYDDNND